MKKVKSSSSFNPWDSAKAGAEKNKPHNLYPCGIPCWRPVVLQSFARIQTFVGFTAVYILSFVALEMYLLAVITSIEKSFGFSSAQSGMLLSIKETFYVSVIAIVSFFARNTHRPRFVCAAGLLASLGGFLCVLPHFFFSKTTILNGAENKHFKRDNFSAEYLCQPESNLQNGSSSLCSSGKHLGSGMNGVAYVFFIAGMALIGLAGTPNNALLVTYVDDHASLKQNGLFLGIINAMKPFGPLLAFMLGGLFTSIYVDLSNPDIPDDDSRWIGAWWLGYLIFPSCMMLCAICLGMFPKRLPPPEGSSNDPVMNNHTLKTSPIVISQSSSSSRTLGCLKGLTPLFSSAGRLLRNPIFLCLTLASCCGSYVVSGMLPFLPKYMETQFMLSASMANILTGVVGALVAGCGTFLGGFVVSRFQLSIGKVSVLLLCLTLLACTCFVPLIFIGCGDHTLNSDSLFSKTNASCTKSCNCNSADFKPVCGTDSYTYLSPCQAGCTAVLHNSTYSDCTCITGRGQASAGPCASRNCPSLVPYLIFLALSALFSMASFVPAMTLFLRTVDPDDRSFALGFSGMMATLLAFIPGPVIYGAMIDTTCDHWQTTCEGKGACLLYNISDFRYKLHGVTFILVIVEAVFHALVLIFVKKLMTVSKLNEPENSSLVLTAPEGESIVECKLSSV